ncbi:MAG: preprotein translocase subunit YajC [Muribaculaceae bacterium]|nr:preprotein translocase subunit YajC [Muribaculaceae bacterium]
MVNNMILLQAPGDGGSAFSSIIMIVLLIAIFYFFMIRPQSQKQKKINEFRAGLKRGDKVITAGGIHGRIRDIKDNSIVILEIDDNVKIKVDLNSIYQSVADAVETGADAKAK